MKAAPQTKQHIMKTKNLNRTALIISMVAIAPVAYAQDDKTSKNQIEEKAAVQAGSLTKLIADSATFSTLTKALKATGLDATLGQKDDFTIFAPTDEAFGKLPAETLTKLMLPENKEKLRMLLLYHVVAGRMLAADLTNGEVKTVNGAKLKIDVSPGKVEVDGAKVFSADVIATNGVMHTIGEVLVPKSLDGFAGLKN
jgi:uncharacterized surface protein with fasciclin (FAS1) repeats